MLLHYSVERLPIAPSHPYSVAISFKVAQRCTVMPNCDHSN